MARALEAGSEFSPVQGTAEYYWGDSNFCVYILRVQLRSSGYLVSLFDVGCLAGQHPQLYSTGRLKQINGENHVSFPGILSSAGVPVARISRLVPAAISQRSPLMVLGWIQSN